MWHSSLVTELLVIRHKAGQGEDGQAREKMDVPGRRWMGQGEGGWVRDGSWMGHGWVRDRSGMGQGEDGWVRDGSGMGQGWVRDRSGMGQGEDGWVRGKIVLV